MKNLFMSFIVVHFLMATFAFAFELPIGKGDLKIIKQKEDAFEILKNIKKYEFIINKNQNSTLVGKLAVVNGEVNRIHEASDKELYNVNDYWASPLEFLINGGDCEDYVIAKYYALINMGVEKEKLFFMVAYDSKLEKDSKHMVLLYVESREYSPLVLDNLIPQILPLNKRDSLTPLFVFNDLESYRLNKEVFLNKIDIDWGVENKKEILFSKIIKKEKA